MSLRINRYRIPHYITAYGTDGMPFPLFCTGRLIIPVPIKTDRRLFRTCFPCNGNRNRGCFVYFLIIPRADFTIDKAADCKITGRKSIHCKNCDSKKDVTEIEITAHSWNEGEVVQEATCQKEGEKVFSKA